MGTTTTNQKRSPNKNGGKKLHAKITMNEDTTHCCSPLQVFSMQVEFIDESQECWELHWRVLFVIQGLLLLLLLLLRPAV